MPRVKRSVAARKKRRKVLEQAKGYWGLKNSSYTLREGAGRALARLRLPRPQEQEADVPAPLDHPHQRGRAPARPLVQPVHRRLQEGRDRARPQVARRPRRQRSGRRSPRRRAGEGRARRPLFLVGAVPAGGCPYRNGRARTSAGSDPSGGQTLGKRQGVEAGVAAEREHPVAERLAASSSSRVRSSSEGHTSAPALAPDRDQDPPLPPPGQQLGERHHPALQIPELARSGGPSGRAGRGESTRGGGCTPAGAGRDRRAARSRRRTRPGRCRELRTSSAGAPRTRVRSRRSRRPRTARAPPGRRSS